TGEVVLVTVLELAPDALVVDELLGLHAAQRVPDELELADLFLVAKADVFEVLVLRLLGPLDLVLLGVAAFELFEFGDVFLDALAPHLRPRYLDAAALADDALEADALVLAAVALPVLRRTEDLLAEEPVLLRLERAVIDRLGLLHLTVRPREDVARGGQVDRE